MAALSKEAKNDYSNTVIYKLRSKNPLIKDFYIGHSKDFHYRQIAHRSTCNNVNSEGHNTPVYIFIRENGGYDNWDFEILETANLKNIDEAETLERDWIEKLEPSLNIQLPAQTPEEKAENYRECDRIRHKKRREDPEFRKKEAEANKKRSQDPEVKKKVAATKKEQITCVCGAIHTRGGKSQHLKSEKHNEFVKNNPQEA